MNDITATFATTPSSMSESAFVEYFGGVYEDTPSIAAITWRDGLDDSHDTVEGLAAVLSSTVDNFDDSDLLNLINAHPDLAGRAAVAGELTPESTSEQTGAGIDQCNAEEFSRFERLNKLYKSKFGFPFIMAVKGSNRHAILKSFEERIENDANAEFERALQEIHKIARLRLREIALTQSASGDGGNVE